MAFSIRKEEPRRQVKPIQQNRSFGFSNYSVDTAMEDSKNESTEPASDPNRIIQERVKRFHETHGDEHITKDHKKAMKEVCAERSFIHTIKSLLHLR